MIAKRQKSSRKTYNSLSTDIEHYTRTENYARQIDRIYQLAIKDAAIAAQGVQLGDKPFAFKDYPQLQSRVKRILQSFSSTIQATILAGVAAEWNEANRVNDLFVKSQFGSQVDISRYTNRNEEALAAFQKRKVNGMNLSDRVWRSAEQFKQELEMGIDIGLGDGRSAAEMSRDIRSYLDQPEKLFRRVRDKHGILQLSKNALAYNPGQGVYRSSYKNAMRVTRTEINMAYRTADYHRWQDMDFVVGFEVKLSNNHPVSDICDDLKGKYPKDFLFRGWHPHCRCHVVSILATDKEFSDLEDKLLNGESTTGFTSQNEVNNLPQNFTQWVSDNEDKIANSKSLPYFLEDNKNFI